MELPLGMVVVIQGLLMKELLEELVPVVEAKVLAHQVVVIQLVLKYTHRVEKEVLVLHQLYKLESHNIMGVAAAEAAFKNLPEETQAQLPMAEAAKVD